MNPTDPSWIGWKLTFPEADKRYWVEMEFPDDSYRNNTFFLRDKVVYSYNFGLGYDSGHDYTLTNSMKTMGAFYWPRTKDGRFLAAPATDRTQGAAVSKVRIYSTGNEPLSPLLAKKKEPERKFATFYEEGSSVFGVYGAVMPHPPLTDILRSLDRWLQTSSYMGYNFAIYTIMVYQAGLHPSKYYGYTRPYSRDVAEMFLLKAQKYGIDAIFEFSPVPNDLIRFYKDENRLRDRFGNVSPYRPHLIPIHPLNWTWLEALAQETLKRYSHSPAFKGIAMRHMNFHNICLTNWQSLDWRYEDFTVSQFEKETGIHVPDTSRTDPSRFEKRYQYLTGPKRGEWIRWRCEKVNQIYRRLAEIAKSIRPDLTVYSHGMFENNPLEAGVDYKALEKIPNVQVIRSNGWYGRRNKGSRRQLVSNMIRNPGDYRNSYIGASYFEYTGNAFLPEHMGYDSKTRRTWSSSIHNAPGRMFLERASVPLGRADMSLYSDGGNTYTIGQPEWRDWIREYRSIPDRPFTLRKDASDPVAVRESRDSFYAVSMVPFDTELVISFANSAPAVKRLFDGSPIPLAKNGTLRLKLKPYELRSFSTISPIRNVKTIIPDAVEKKYSIMLSALQDAIRNLTENDAEHVSVLALKLKHALNGKHYWMFRALLDDSELLLEKSGILLPFYYEDGAPVTPENAFAAKKLQSFCKSEAFLIPSEKFLTGWSGENLLISRPGNPLLLDLPVPAVGKYHLRIGYASAQEYGNISLKIDGQTIGRVISSGNAPVAREILFPASALLRDGIKRLEILPENGKSVAVSYVSLESVPTPISGFRWKIGPAHPAKSMDRVLNTEKTFDSIGWQIGNGTNSYVSLTLGNPSYIPEQVRFAVTYIYSPDSRKVRLFYGADYWIKMWLNRKCVKPSAVRTRGGAPNPREDIIDLQLKPGWNEFMIKVASGGHGFGVWMEISNPDDLRFSANPVEKKQVRIPDIPAKGKALIQTGFETPFPHGKLKRTESENNAHSGKFYAEVTGNVQFGFSVTPGKMYLFQGYIKGISDLSNGRIQGMAEQGTKSPIYALPTRTPLHGLEFIPGDGQSSLRSGVRLHRHRRNLRG